MAQYSKTIEKAVFIDRDGVINPLVYSAENGTVDSPFCPKHFKLLPKVGKAIRILNALNYKVVIVSNQPGIAKNKCKLADLKLIESKMLSSLKRKNATIDDIYYCLHHPAALNLFYKKVCRCRKPKPGLILNAAKKHNINLALSYMIGDNISDIQAGNAAGCKTIFIGLLKCDHCKIMHKKGIHPDFIVKDLFEAATLIKRTYEVRDK